MALVVVGTMSFSATKVFVNDATGTYDALTNPTGYGSPNAAFADYAHYALIRKKNVNSVADELLTMDSFNPLTATEFSADRAVDGWFEGKLLTILKWTAGTYAAGVVKYYSGSLYMANTSTSTTPGGGAWNIVTDLTTIEDNTSITTTTIGRVTPYDADTYWGQQTAMQAQQGTLWNVDDRVSARLDTIYRLIQQVLSSDQLGNNTQGEFTILRLQKMGAKRDV